MFEEIKEKKDKTKRLTRSEALQAEEDAKNKAIDSVMAEEPDEPEIDPL